MEDEMQPEITLALQMLIFVAIPFLLFCYFIMKIYPRILDRREFKVFFGFTYNCFNVERLVRERTLLLEEELRVLLTSAIEVFKSSTFIDISSSDTDFLITMWKIQTEIVQRKVKEIERAKLLAEKFNLKNEKFSVSTTLD